MAGTETETISRPEAVLTSAAAVLVVEALQRNDVSRCGLWNASRSVWQRYDRPWNGPAGSRGEAELVGTIALTYGRPGPDDVTIYKVTVTAPGSRQRWTPESLANEALHYAALTLAACRRANAVDVPEQRRSSVWETDVADLLRTDIRELRSKLRG